MIDFMRTRHHIYIALLLITLMSFGAVYVTIAQGDIDPWAPLNEELPTRVASHDIALYLNKFIYVIGGRTEEDLPLADVYLVDLSNRSAGVGTGYAGGEGLPTAVYAHAAVTDNKRIYVIGGFDGDNWLSDVWSATIEENTGNIIDWQQEIGYPLKIALHDAVVHGDRIFVIGGEDGTTIKNTNKVYYSTIQTPGTGQESSLSSWRLAPPLPAPVRRMAAVVIGDFIYVLGGLAGLDDNEVVQSTIYRSRVGVAGAAVTPAPWSTYTTTLPLPLEYHSAVLHSGQLIVLGGRLQNGDVNDQVYGYNITNAAGDLSAWITLPTLSEGLYRSGVVSVPLAPSSTDTSVTASPQPAELYIFGGIKNNDEHTSKIWVNLLATPTPTPSPTATDTPTPTLTPTPMPTPTPAPGIKSIRLSQDPHGGLEAGDRLTYTIRFENGPYTLTNVIISNRLPEDIIPLPDSVTVEPIPQATTSPNMFIPDQEIIWDFGNMAMNQIGRITYAVELPPPPVLKITLSAPARVEVDQTFTYDFTVIITTDEIFERLLITHTLPVQVCQPSGVLCVPNPVPVPIMLEDGPYSSNNPIVARISAKVVDSKSPIVNHDYSVCAADEERNCTSELTTSIGTDLAVTYIGEEPPEPPLSQPIETVKIVNEGVTIFWVDPNNTGKRAMLESGAIYYPPNDLYFPVVNR